MIVLGIHDGHDAGACLSRDGRIVLASSEERRRNIKNYAGVPELSIAALFKRSGISPSDVDLVALSGLVRNTSPTREQHTHRKRLLFSALALGSWVARTEVGTRLGRFFLSRMRRRRELLERLADLGIGDKPLRAYDHHLTHAACAYFHRPWEGDALILTHDGAGDGLCATVNVGKGLEISVVSQTPKYHSLANWMYSSVTRHLGLKPWEHEYKVMGMAPYGQAGYVAPILREMYGVEGLHFRNKTGRVAQPLQRLLARRLYCQRFDNIAAGCQQVFEELMLQWVRNAIAATGVRKVCAAGGAFLNVKANKLIREMEGVEAFYAYPASDDGGTPIGAAILGYLDLCRQEGAPPKLDLPRDMYLGLEFGEAETEAAAKVSGLPFERMAEPAKRIARLLADGKIVARFSGREELGPRALGNRSILADPRDLRQIRKLNFAIKYRDFWMPFATSMLREDAEKYVKNLSGWPYWMIEAYDTHPSAKDAFIAGMHPFDLTVRPQVVDELNPSYREIIQEFKTLTGIGTILNTSFNLHGFPIVGTPEIAIDTLKKSELDALALGPFLITKPPAA
ncbi:MAG: carbamoyltransferase C-terminal domain-containing protein [Gammaproteobacteria bacterium]